MDETSMGLFDAFQSIPRRTGRPLVEFTLRALRGNGFAPRAILDIGAYEGGWATTIKRIFPAASVLMVEAQEDKRATLEQLARRDPESFEVVIALLGADTRAEVPFQLMKTGSSMFPEMTSAPRTTTTLPMRTCDDVVAESRFEAFDMIKLDVQGAELAVLEGAPRTLAGAEIVFLEVSVLPYNEGAPSFAEVIRFLDDRGYVLFDIASMMRAPGDALSQCDLIFIRQDSKIRERLLEDQLGRYADVPQ